MTHHDHKDGGCCSGDKSHDHGKPEKEKCCESKTKVSEAEKTEKQGGCCGGKK